MLAVVMLMCTHVMLACLVSVGSVMLMSTHVMLACLVSVGSSDAYVHS